MHPGVESDKTGDCASLNDGACVRIGDVMAKTHQVPLSVRDYGGVVVGKGGIYWEEG